MDLIHTIVSDDESASARSDCLEASSSLEATGLQGQVLDDLAFIAASLAADTQVEFMPPPNLPVKITDPSDAFSNSSKAVQGCIVPDSDSDSESDNASPEEDFVTLQDLLTEEEECVATGPGEVPRTKNELGDEEVLEAEHEDVNDGDRLTAAGHIHSHIVDERCIVVQAFTTPLALAEDSVLCLCLRDDTENAIMGVDMPQSYCVSTAASAESQGRRDIAADRVVVLGAIQEVFGPLHRPYYVLRYRRPDQLAGDGCMSSDSEVHTADPVRDAWATRCSLRDQAMRPGALVYSLERRTRTLQEAELAAMQIKGSDASNVYDEEVTGSDVDFSDDEAEAVARARAKAARRLVGGVASTVGKEVSQAASARRKIRAPRRAATDIAYSYPANSTDGPVRASILFTPYSQEQYFQPPHQQHSCSQRLGGSMYHASPQGVYQHWQSYMPQPTVHPFLQHQTHIYAPPLPPGPPPSSR